MNHEPGEGRGPAGARDALFEPTPPAPNVTAPATAREAAPVAPRHDWRSEIVSLSGLNVIAGIWLIIAPWVLGYSGRDPRWNDVVFGIIVGIFALVRAT